MERLLQFFIVTILSLPDQARDRIQIVGYSNVYTFATVVAAKMGKKGFKTPVIESTGMFGGMIFLQVLVQSTRK